MAIVTTYSFETMTAQFRANFAQTSGNQSLPEITILPNGNIVYTYFGSRTWGDVVSRTGAAVDTGNSLAVPSIERLADADVLTSGNLALVVPDTASGGAHSYTRVLTPALSGATSYINVEPETDSQEDARLAALVNGGYVVVHRDQNEGSTTSNAINFHRYNNDGVLQGGTVEVAASVNGDNVLDGRIAALNSGQFVVVWAQDAAAGTGPVNYDLYFRRYNSNGTPASAAVAIETAADNQRLPEVAALGDGGFVVVWVDEVDGSQIDTEIRYEIRNADGSFRSEGLVYNATGTFKVDQVSVSRIGLNHWGVTFVTEENGNFDTLMQARTNAGLQVGDTHQLAAGQFDQDQADIAGRGNGQFVAAWRDTNAAGDGAGSSVQSVIKQFVRTTTGDASSGFLTGDDLRDVIAGAAGGDFIIGGGGGDSLDGGADFDAVSWYGAAVGLTVNLFSQNLNAGAAAGDTVANFEAYYLTAFNDAFTNDDGGGYIYGFEGNDTLIGGAGVDILDGGAGADGLDGGDNFDYANYNSSGAGVTINLVNLAANGGSAIGDTFQNIEAFFLTEFADTFTGGPGQNFAFGFGGDDTLIGGASANEWLIGGDGNDTLTGGTLNDLLSGGAGADSYVYLGLADGFDSIADFQTGVDKFRFDKTAFGKNAGHTFSAGVDFIAGASPFATGATGTILYATGLGILYFDADGSGSGAAVALAQITGAPTVAASDFIVF